MRRGLGSVRDRSDGWCDLGVKCSGGWCLAESDSCMYVSVHACAVCMCVCSKVTLGLGLEG